MSFGTNPYEKVSTFNITYLSWCVLQCTKDLFIYKYSLESVNIIMQLHIELCPCEITESLKYAYAMMISTHAVYKHCKYKSFLHQCILQKNMAWQNCFQANNRNEQPATCNFSERSSENTRPSTYNGRVQTLCNISKFRFETNSDIWWQIHRFTYRTIG